MDHDSVLAHAAMSVNNPPQPGLAGCGPAMVHVHVHAWPWPRTLSGSPARGRALDLCMHASLYN